MRIIYLESNAFTQTGKIVKLEYPQKVNTVSEPTARRNAEITAVVQVSPRDEKLKIKNIAPRIRFEPKRYCTGGSPFRFTVGLF